MSGGEPKGGITGRGLAIAVVAALSLLVLCAPGVSAAPASLLKDINPGSGDSDAGGYSGFTKLGGSEFFCAYDGIHGDELWRTDGTSAGTELVKNIYPGYQGSYPCELTKLGGRLYFRADDRRHGEELWRTDGTRSGTKLVEDIRPGDRDSDPAFLTRVGHVLLFGANDGTDGWEPWRTNGTTRGTRLVRDIRPGRRGSNDALWHFADPTNVDGTVLFAADDGKHGMELWRSDGTKSGTKLVKDIDPGGDPSDPYSLTARGRTMFFAAGDGRHGSELWKSHGTQASTKLVENIRPHRRSSFPADITQVDRRVFFVADDGRHGAELWKSRGTANRTKLVEDINPHRAGTNLGMPEFLTNVGGTLFFDARDPEHGVELWKSNGSAGNTKLVKEIVPGFERPPVNRPYGLTDAGGTLFFDANDGTTGVELWRSDGTRRGTRLFQDIRPGAGGSKPSVMTYIDGTLFFAADDGTHGVEPWTLAR